MEEEVGRLSVAAADEEAPEAHEEDDDRHAEVFPDEAALDAAGYMNQTKSDLLAITLPTNKIGIMANNIKHFKKKQGVETFGSLQAAREEKKQHKRHNPGR